jgi:hypothetical protein
MPRVQRPDGHVEPARRKSRIDHATAKSVDLLVERRASQSLLDKPVGEAGQIEWRRRLVGSGAATPVHPISIASSST